MRRSSKIIFLFMFILTTLLLANVSMASEKGIVNGTTLRVRYEPNTTSSVLFNLYKKDEVEILEENGEWYKILYEDKIGWASKQYISINSNVGTTKAVTQETELLILPTINSKSKATIAKGEKVTVFEDINGWTNIEYNGLNGWIRQNGIGEIKVEEKVIKTVYVDVASARVREKATTDSKEIDTLKADDKISVIGQEGNWYKIKLSNKTGYILKDLTRTTKESTKVSRSGSATSKPKENNTTNSANNNNTNTSNNENAVNNSNNTNNNNNNSSSGNTAPSGNSSKQEQVVSYAKQFLGYQYVYGGSGPKTFDCSGFTQYVYKKFGISLLHSARRQANVGTYVKKSNLQKGDLVFFSQDGGGKNIGHVGIYVGGNQFIHASSPTRGVRYDSLSSSYYTKNYVTARRLL